ncbi:GNAT family N-acetyltransferase [Clostridium sardiniense]|uniref:GNAT family N-acetyltransferase n=1 Tax=Clostridium sardiniense TaxID=29369 RepID=UPI00195AE075|nr:GNAT family N-acetyltransferase [Clostridium sardiniense]MBM7833165.1 putative acetyltransferase [Clostridium sardiniense]
MDNNKTLRFEPITKDDIIPLTDIMTRAFDSDSKLHTDNEKDGPTGYDNGDFLRKWALESPSESYKILLDNRLIGSFIVFINENQENYLGNIFIDPDIHNKGLGLKVWKYIESKYPNTKKWTTETPGFSKRNHNFYVNKCGFKIVKILNPHDLHIETYVLEKEIL